MRVNTDRMRKLLVLNFFPAFYPPSSGGEQRYYCLYHHLSQNFDITLLSPTYADQRDELIEFHEHFREWRVPKSSYHNELHVQLDADGIGPECSALVCALASEQDDAYRSRYRSLIVDADVVVHECPFMLNYDEEFGRDGRPRVYNSYNVEALLAEAMLQGQDNFECVALIRALERRLVEDSVSIGASSQEDKIRFIELYHCDPAKVSLLPNGFDPAGDDESNPPAGHFPDSFVLFLGSAHPPNVQAANLLCEVARSKPDVRFVFAGSVCSAVKEVPGNVCKLGQVTPGEKKWLLEQCGIAVNPVITGGGSNLKMLDYMAAGAAIVTTPFGARGIDIDDGAHCLMRALSEFGGAIDALLADKAARARIGEAARARAYEKYTWGAIASRAKVMIDGAIKPNRVADAEKPRLLLLNDFPIHAPRGGGELRIYNLYTRLAAWYRITLLCLSDEETVEVRRLAGDLVQISVPKAKDHKYLEHHLNRMSIISTADIVSALCCSDNAELVSRFRSLSNSADILVFIHPYLAPLLGALARPLPAVYESLNVETEMKSQFLTEHPFQKELLETVYEVESYIARNAFRILSVSVEDRNLFAGRGFAAKTHVVPNGVAVNTDAGAWVPSLQDRKPIALFMGSGHPPNIEAVKFIVESLAPALPEVTFLVLGGVCDAVASGLMPENVALRGFVTEEEKRNALLQARLGINPMFSGGGSNLKVAECFAAGLPVVSTPFGIRGYEVVHGCHVALAERETFAAAIRELIGDFQTLAKMATEAQRYAVEHLDWHVLARQLRATIDDCLTSRPNRLLVVTYRYTEPPRGGAETYLQNILLEMWHRGTFAIDIATVTVDTIRDWMHFSAKYVESRQPLGVLEASFGRVFKFPLDTPDPEAVRRGVEQLFDLWQSETLTHARQFTPSYRASTLMGGWYPLESDGNGFRRWCGAKAEIFCGAGTKAILIRGFTPDHTAVRVSTEKERQLFQGTVNGSFTVYVDLPDATGTILQLETDARQRSPDDPRKLGICVTYLRETGDDFVRDFSVATDFESMLRMEDPARWIASLLDLTQSRNVDIDELFYHVRGPHSTELCRFLHRHAGDYDIILVHGIPFSTAVSATQIAKYSGTPIVLLPHFHLDDRYYHWRCFYEAFRSADLVLAAPESARSCVFEPLGAHAISIPGGAVHTGEFSEIESKRRLFLELYRRQRPFVLVLGRKTAAKHYQKVIEAARALNGAEIRIEVVLIGPDEDGTPVNEPFATYLGSQSREVIVGALASCVCLASMSESESFGIVLVEAWMSGRPVLANYNCLAFRELVEEGKDGMLCRNVEELAAGIRLFLERPEIATKYGNAGRQKATMKYTWPRLVDTIIPEILALKKGAEDRIRSAASTQGANQPSAQR